MAGASTEEENAANAAVAKGGKDLQQTNMEWLMGATDSDLERRMEAATEAAKISERGMKEASEEADVKGRRQSCRFRLFLRDLVHCYCRIYRRVHIRKGSYFY